MKQFLKIVMAAMLIMTNSVVAMAQSNNGQRISREKLALKQAKFISNQLALESNQAEKFIDTYCNYQEEVWALGPRIKKKGDASEDEIKAQMHARFERSQKILQLREKYYEKYSEFLTAKQIERVYQIEKQMLNRLGKHKAKQRGNNQRKQLSNE